MDTFLIAMRTLHYAACASLEGAFVFSCLIARPVLSLWDAGAAMRPLHDRRLIALAWASLALAVLSGIAWLFLEASHMSGAALADVLRPNGTVALVLTQTRFGTDWIVRFVLAVTIAACLRIRMRRERPWAEWIALLASAALLASLAWVGHGGAKDSMPGDWLHLPADLLHLTAAGAWLGSLAPLALFLAQSRRANGAASHAAAAAARRFSVLGVASVGMLLVTGLVNTWFLSGSVPALIGTPYGRLVILKVVLFTAMVAVASVNRFRLSPQLGGTGPSSIDSIRQLQRNAAIESCLGFLVLAIVGVLGILPPGFHTQPEWPLPFKIGIDDLTSGQTTLVEVAGLLLVACLASTVITAALRKYLVLALSAFGISLSLVVGWSASWEAIEKAYPTSYYTSPEVFAAPSVARGKPLYSNCVECHGVDGHGDGPLADSLPIHPANLTEPHLFGHGAGELFWWISHGRDNGVMPAFANELKPTQRWDLINFVLARAAGDLTQKIGPQVTSEAAPPVPDFAFQQNGTQKTLNQMLQSGPVLLVLYATPVPRARLTELATAQAPLAKDGLRIIAFAISPPDGTPDMLQSPLTVAVSREVSETLSLFAKPAPGNEAEFLVDRSGVRARWTSDDPDGLANLATLAADATKVAAEPVAGLSQSGMAGMPGM